MIRTEDRDITAQANVGYRTTPLRLADGEYSVARFHAYAKSGTWAGGASGTRWEIKCTNFDPDDHPGSWTSLETPVFLTAAGVTPEFSVQGILYVCAEIISTHADENATMNAAMTASRGL